MSYAGAYVGVVLGDFLGVAGAGLPPDVDPPEVIVVSPAANANIRSDQILTIDVTDDTGLTLAGIIATFPDGTEDVVHTGARWGRFYKTAANTRTPTASGFRFTVRRDGNWIGSPTFEFQVVDISGKAGILG